MSDSIPRIRGVAEGPPREPGSGRTGGSDQTSPDLGAASRSLVPAGPAVRASEAASEPMLSGAAAFATQVLGQSGRKRGLKGGPPVLDEAKSAYLEAEWSGPHDRRAQTGQITRTKV